ncbi:hypothetical protein ABT063_14140, partial [Streptomyces sp. NPDC002838]|uniref:hypothetical protein n=1 Tax=Streptomyces sp. NPDC002838 TaxID=3154436 RepID=UPI0033277B63
PGFALHTDFPGAEELARRLPEGPPAAAFGHPHCPISRSNAQPRRSETGTAHRNRAHTGSIGPATGLVGAAHPL